MTQSTKSIYKKHIFIVLLLLVKLNNNKWLQARRHTVHILRKPWRASVFRFSGS